jgi:hypothetical protein
VVIAQEPKIAHYREAIRDTIAGLTKIAIENGVIKGKTTEGWGFKAGERGLRYMQLPLLKGKKWLARGEKGSDKGEVCTESNRPSPYRELKDSHSQLSICKKRERDLSIKDRRYRHREV